MTWTPQPGPQADAITATWCPELCFGGARGGGKSEFLLGDFLQDVPRYHQAWRGILVRKTNNELEEILARSQEMYPPTGALWEAGKRTWSWPNGATLKLRYLEREDDANRYQGHQYTWVGFDEMGTHATDRGYRKLMACLRSSHDVPTKRVRISCNPGGPGHGWIKERFITPARLGYTPLFDEETKMWRVFIPSKLTDNQILLANDPGYLDRLRGVGSPELVRAWLEGDWDVVLGAFFSEFRVDRHVIRPFAVPAHWQRFRAFDWGSAKPFVCLWIAVSDGSCVRCFGRNGCDSCESYPRGALIVYREWYGGKDNVGLKLTVEEIARGILERQTPGEQIAYSVADPSIAKADGGPSHMERFAREKIHWRPADNNRLAGWDQVRARLRGDGDGRPGLYLFATCPEGIRSIPTAQHDESRPEDIDTEADDHWLDALRYGCMSRPYVGDRKVELPPRGVENMTFNELINARTTRARRW